MINIIKKYNKGIILTIIGLMVVDITLIATKQIYATSIEEDVTETDVTETTVTEAEQPRELTEIDYLEIFLNNHEEEIIFLSDTFQIDSNTLKELLVANYQEFDLLNQSDFVSFLINYLFTLEDSDETLFTSTITPCNDTPEYIIALIKYFTSVYESVDFSIAAAIADVESNYTAPSMMSKNNIYGGFASGRLIKYKNIEYGVLSYIKLLNDGYFEKGLVTVESIGKVYNPTYNEAGERIASPSWVTKVNNALSKYEDYSDVDLNVLNSLKTIA